MGVEVLPPKRVREGSKGWGWNHIRQAGRDCLCRGRAMRGRVCFPSQGVCELSKGVGSAIRVGNWGGPLGAERGLWGGWVYLLSFTRCGQERAVGAWWDQGGHWERPLGAERGLWGGSGLCAFFFRACVSAARGGL